MRESPLVIGVVDPLPMVRRELCTSLERLGFRTVDAPADPVAFLHGRADRGLVASLTGGFGMVQLDRALLAARGAPIVALVDEATPDVYVELLLRGRAFPAWRNATADVIARCVAAAIDGLCLLPSVVARQLAQAMPGVDGGLSGQELSWLRRLAAGATVSELADLIGYSERSAYRRLRELYAKLGARTRAEAVMQLARRGLLEEGRETVGSAS